MDTWDALVVNLAYSVNSWPVYTPFQTKQSGQDSMNDTHI